MKKTRSTSLLALLWTVGILTILASSLEEEGPPSNPPTPTVVDYSLTSLASPLTQDIDTRTVTLDDLILSGEYSANQGDKLTLDRVITLDANSRYKITVTATDPDELLDGTADVEIAAALDVGLGHDPAAGQLTTLLDGTTTVVTVNGGGVDVVTGDSPTADFFSFDDFAAKEDDNDATVDLRMAAAAWNIIDVVLRATLLAESIIDDVESNKTTLEGMNLDSDLALTCDNTAAEREGRYILFWTGDAAGSGAGTIGDGDAFEARFENCRNLDRERYRDGTVALDGYNPDDSDGFSIFGVEVEMTELFLAEGEVDDLLTTPTAESPRINGELFLFYIEQPAP